MGVSQSKQFADLVTAPRCETNKFMGTWFVIGVKPTPFETTCSNAVETYTRLQGKSHDINIDFKYNKSDPITSPIKSLPQKGYIVGDKEDSSSWKVSPLPLVKMPYPIIEVDDQNYEWVVVGHNARSYVWIMARKPVMDDDLYNSLTTKLVEKHQYDLEGLRKVPQKWTRKERAERKLENEIPDELLVSE